MFDREAVFIERVLAPLLRELPGLKVVFEHATTEEAVAFVESAGPNVAATITPQHLHLNRNAMLVGGIRPHAYCLPVAKREQHRLALRRAATSGSPKFFLGTDSAPHLREAKESACGCAGIFNAPFALESYLAVFEEEGALDRFEGFASEHGPRFYGLPLNEGTVTLERAPVEVPGGDRRRRPVPRRRDARLALRRLGRDRLLGLAPAQQLPGEQRRRRPDQHVAGELRGPQLLAEHGQAEQEHDRRRAELEEADHRVGHAPRGDGEHISGIAVIGPLQRDRQRRAPALRRAPGPPGVVAVPADDRQRDRAAGSAIRPSARPARPPRTVLRSRP